MLHIHSLLYLHQETCGHCMMNESGSHGSECVYITLVSPGESCCYWFLLQFPGSVLTCRHQHCAKVCGATHFPSALKWHILACCLNRGHQEDSVLLTSEFHLEGGDVPVAPTSVMQQLSDVESERWWIDWVSKSAEHAEIRVTAASGFKSVLWLLSGSGAHKLPPLSSGTLRK